MKKSSFFLSMLMLLALSTANLQADEATFTYANTQWTTTAGPQSTVVDGVTVATTNGVKNATNSDFRSYANATLTISSSNTITKIVFTYSNKDITAASVGTWDKDTKTWTGSTTSIDFTQDGQVRFTKIVVTYEASTSPYVSATPTSVDFGTEVEEVGNATKSFQLKGGNLNDDVVLAISSPTFRIAAAGYPSGLTSLTIKPTAGAIDTAITLLAYKGTVGDFASSLTINSKADPVEFSEVTVPVALTVVAPVASYNIDFETGNLAAYVNWNFSNITPATTAIAPHAGSYYGNTSGKMTASITTKEKIFLPDSLKFFISKESDNTTATSWKAQVSTDGENWTDVSTFDAKEMAKGVWNECKVDLSSYNNVYVQIIHTGSTAVRAIDDISLTEREPAEVEKPMLSGATPFLHTTTVSITCITPGSEIRYTIDNSDPTSSSTLYSAPFTLEATTTIKAKAFKGSKESAITTKTFTKVVPLSVADALITIASLTEGGKTPDSVYVVGYVKSISEISQSNATYILQDLNVDNALTIFQGYYVGNTEFTSAAQFNVGDKVVVKGLLQKYKSGDVIIPEATKGNYIVERTERGAVTSLALGGELLKTSGYEAGDIISTEGLTATATFANSFVKDVTAEAAWTVDGYEQKVIYNSESDYVFAATYGGQTKTKVIRVYANTHAVTFNQPAHGTLTVKYAGTPITSGETFTKGAKLTVEVSVDDDYQLTALKAGEEDILASKTFTVGTSDVAVVATITKIQKPCLLTLHIATYPDRGIAEAELFKAISFETFDNDDTAGHDFVQYDADDNIVMKGTFYDGTVLNFENFESQSYKFVKWDDPEETDFYRGVEIFSDTTVTLYVAPILLQPRIASQDEAKGTVTLVVANPLPVSEFFNEESTWTLQIKATPKPGYKFLGWGPFDLEKAVGEDPELDWFDGQYLTVEDFFADIKAYYDQLVAAGDVLNEQQKAYREYLKQIFSTEATFRPFQIYEYEVAFDFDFNEEYYSVKAFFTEDTNTSINSQMVNGKCPNGKLIKDGHLFLLHDGKTFTITGQELK